jgi:hypothetical protein
VEVWPGDPTRGARQSDDGASIEDLPGCDVYVGQVRVDRADLARVVDDDHETVAGQGAGEVHTSRGHGADGRARGDGDVDSAVDPDVESFPAEPERRGNGPVHGPAREGAPGQEEGQEAEDHGSHAGGKLCRWELRRNVATRTVPAWGRRGFSG